ncbi:alpha/beta fold hydrolase [Psychromarinibacter sp. C21-152]|uniref:Alpha/beta fold hydrolase n=1 Tax=Psychromarinibacter sediminicola TaxID=3033385 RepID=A0AAE3NMQ6_9RHOB|nr:alpha/beta fold hydrolase [Psychromarinibacter sediminicola]MDF0599119.1 alpha/beta fold hydrolase [Psychromarinibacter sediminicola]
MTPLVLLPGMMCDARLFGPQFAAFSGSRAMQCAPIGGAATMTELAAQVLADAPPRFALAGLSMGGIVAMEIAAQAPERLAGLALLDTNPLAERPEVQARRAPQMDKARAGALHAVMRDEMKPNYLTEGPNRTAILDLCMEMAMALGPEQFVNQSLALRDRPDRQETLRSVTCPTLILCGWDDALCPVERHALMHDLVADSRLVVIERAGHLPTLEQPEKTNAALADWLETTDE